MTTEKYKSLVVAGPTASGKTALGVQLAGLLKGEILSVDSRQVYRGLDIGSGKDLSEYVYDGKALPYHLIDIADLDTEFSVFHYQQAFYAAFDDLCERKKLPVIVGGTGMYLEAVLSDYHLPAVPENPKLREVLQDLDEEALEERLRQLKPTLHDETDLENRERIIRAIEIAEFSASIPQSAKKDPAPFILVVAYPPDVLRARIALRLRARMDEGLIEEVEALHEGAADWQRLEQLGLEYRFVAQYLQGKILNKNDLFQKLNSAIAQFAKRQRTWFRGMERRGFTVHWIPEASLHAALQAIGQSSF